MRYHVIGCVALALAACTKAPPTPGTGKMPMSQLVGSSDSDFAAAHVKLSHIAGQSPLADIHKPVGTIVLTTDSSALQLSAFVPHHSKNVGYLDEFGVRTIVLPPSAIRTLVDSLASGQGLALDALPAHPSLSVIVIRGGQGGTRASEVFIDAAQTHRFAALVTDRCIGTRSFETCAHWENNVR